MGTNVRPRNPAQPVSLTWVPVGDGELLESWLRRFAWERGEPIDWVLARLDADRFVGVEGSAWLWRMHPDVLERLAAFARVDPEVLRAAELSTATAGLLPSVSSALDLKRRAWASLGTLRYCPVCIGEGGGFRWRWVFGCTVACADHGVLLRLGCGSCGEQRWTRYVGPPSYERPIDVCPSCDETLAHATACVASAPLLVAQRAADAVINGRTADLFGEPVDRAVWFASLTCTAVLASIALGVGKGTSSTKPAAIPTNPDVLGSVLPMAVDALASVDAFVALVEAALTAHRPKIRFVLTPDVLPEVLVPLWDSVSIDLRMGCDRFVHDVEQLRSWRPPPMESEGARRGGAIT